MSRIGFVNQRWWLVVIFLAEVTAPVSVLPLNIKPE